MKLFTGLEEIVKKDYPLAPRTWMKLGGRATYYIEPTGVEDLAEVVLRCRENEIPIYVLGSGANVLIDDSGVNGAVIHLMKRDLRRASLQRRFLLFPRGRRSDR